MNRAGGGSHPVPPPVRRKVFFLIPTLTGGGAERVVVTLLRHLDRKLFAPTLVVVSMRDAVFRDDVPRDVELIDLGRSRVRYALVRICRLIWQRKPDVVFSTLDHLNLALAILRPLLPGGVRYVAREAVGLDDLLNDYTWPGLWAWAYRRFYRRFDRVVCQSRRMQEDIVAKFGVPASTTVVIPNPVEVARVRELSAESLLDEYANWFGTASAFNLVAAGRLSHQKGFDILIEAVALCRDPDIHLTILGEGALKSELMQLTKERGIAPQVRLIGFQRNPYKFFIRADAFVLSSRFEGFPNVVLEALACGVPVIATPAEVEVAHMLKGIPGCSVAASVTPEALCTSIQERRALGAVRPAVSAVDRFSAREVSEQYQAVLVG